MFTTGNVYPCRGYTLDYGVNNLSTLTCWYVYRHNQRGRQVFRTRKPSDSPRVSLYQFTWTRPTYCLPLLPDKIKHEVYIVLIWRFEIGTRCKKYVHRVIWISLLRTTSNLEYGSIFQGFTQQTYPNKWANPLTFTYFQLTWTYDALFYTFVNVPGLLHLLYYCIISDVTFEKREYIYIYIWKKVWLKYDQ